MWALCFISDSIDRKAWLSSVAVIHESSATDQQIHTDSKTPFANSAQTEYCPTFLCVLVSHRRDISSFLDNLTV